MSWVAERIEHWPIARLLPYARNARTHSDEQVAQIAASIVEFGFTNPILVGSDGVIVAGHGRLAAARKLQLQTVPVVVLDHLTPTQRRALVIADNRIAENAGWDDAILRAELEALQEAGYDLDLTGFDPDALAELLADEETYHAGETDDDEVPEADAIAVSRPGDLWRLGEHRLLCGDATDAVAVARLLDGARPHLMATDPPYGVEYDPGWRVRMGVTTTQRTGQVCNDDRADWRDAWALFPGDVAYVWHGALHASIVQESLESCGFGLRAQIVWVKPRIVLSRGHYHWRHEACWYAVRHGSTGHWTGARDQSTVWEIGHAGAEDEATTHGTQKPVEAMLRPIVNNSDRGDAVYEPFSGSGTTLIACEKSGRRALAMEIDPRYVDVAILRWQRYTGLDAFAEDGRSFDQVRAESAATMDCSFDADGSV